MRDAKSEVVTIAITNHMEREYRRRNVFPSVRLESTIFAYQRLLFTVPVALAHDMLCDAYEQREDKRLRPGIRRAYTMLSRSLMTVLHAEPQPVAQQPEQHAPAADGPTLYNELTEREQALIRAFRNMPPEPGRMLLGLAKSYGDMMDAHKESRTANRPRLSLVEARVGGAA